MSECSVVPSSVSKYFYVIPYGRKFSRVQTLTIMPLEASEENFMAVFIFAIGGSSSKTAKVCTM